MKKIFKIPFLFILALVQSLSFSQASASESMQPEGEPICIKAGIHNPRSIVTTPACYYSHGVVYIKGGEEVTAISATVTGLDSNQQWTGSARGNELSIRFSTDPGTYYLEINLSGGAVFYGSFEIPDNRVRKKQIPGM